MSGITLGVGAHVERAACAAVQGGRLLSACTGERFTRTVHDSCFPGQAILACLKACGRGPDDVRAIAVPLRPASIIYKRFIPMLTGFPRTIAWSSSYCDTMAMLLTLKWRLQDFFCRNVPVIHVGHHLSHAASAFRMSGFEKALVLVIDGMGEYASTSVYLGFDKRLRLVLEIPFPHSLGYFYETITTYLGFRHYEAGKTMGLSAYGDDSLHAKMSELIKEGRRGTYRIDTDYFAYQYCNNRLDPSTYHSDLFVETFGPPRMPGEVIQKRHRDIASAAQHLLEETVLRLVKKHLPGGWALCVSGGVALNSPMNARLASLAGNAGFFAMPASGDCGSSAGAALVADSMRRNKKR